MSKTGRYDKFLIEQLKQDVAFAKAYFEEACNGCDWQAFDVARQNLKKAGYEIGIRKLDTGAKKAEGSQ